MRDCELPFVFRALLAFHVTVLGMHLGWAAAPPRPSDRPVTADDLHAVTRLKWQDGLYAIAFDKDGTYHCGPREGDCQQLNWTGNWQFDPLTRTVTLEEATLVVYPDEAPRRGDPYTVHLTLARRGASLRGVGWQGKPVVLE